MVYLAEEGRKDRRTKTPDFFPTKGGEKRLKAPQRGVFPPSRSPLAGTPPWQHTTSPVGLLPCVHNSSGASGKRGMLTRTKFRCRMLGHGEQAVLVDLLRGDDHRHVKHFSTRFDFFSTHTRSTIVQRGGCDQIRTRSRRLSLAMPRHTKAPPTRPRQ